MTEREYSMILDHEELSALVKQHCSLTISMSPKQIFWDVQQDGKINCVVTMTIPDGEKGVGL